MVPHIPKIIGWKIAIFQLLQLQLISQRVGLRSKRFTKLRRSAHLVNCKSKEVLYAGLSRMERLHIFRGRLFKIPQV